jgi:purine-binding chemotaxis protein CheW
MQHPWMSTAETGFEIPSESQLRDLFSFSAGDRTFAVFVEDVEGTIDSKRATPLPHAPAAVLGVVCVRGRMLTVLDPVALLSGEALNWPSELPCIIGLRGDEQLALAAESFGETFTVAAADIEPLSETDVDQSGNVVVGISRHAGAEITILNTGNLFMAAVHRKERRRRRF